ncbi:SDR family NAD(P)-dependent oxidoreductase [Pleurocapsales cyanobacterium LEGE 06147]|nr:SDR family NAD(P)-dependent oxidoreductase [Pleurocapsales cyanobacterium LEGE 06147]
MKSEQTGLEVAIIGISGRFPGSRDVNIFWENLVNGREFSSVFSKLEIETNGSNKEIKAAALLENIDLFDASFFGFSPREAEIMDPQHRIFLECAWEALENAGYDSQREERPIRVYAGVGRSTYLLYNLCPNNLNETLGYFPILLASDKDYVPTRVSYKLNLKGPSVSLGTACSSSLVAVHLACQSLLSGDCDMALAAGVSVKAPQNEATLCPEGISPDGHCFAFDARANGTIGGNGIGVVVLKRLEDAITDRDYIYAVIKGSAINNDGAVKVSYTAPSEEAQARVIRAAQIMAEVEPETISYIETHGTGTSMGDPIEIAGLKQAFPMDQKSFCAIGSVKTNIGHLDAAAGIASFIKTTLALNYKLLPPSLNFETPNPQIDFADSPFYVNTKLSEWKTNGIPRRAGVSSFGFGGTNAHVIVEEAPPVGTSTTSRPQQLLLLSAKTSSALDTATANLSQHLQRQPQLNLADVAYTLQVGRREFEHRRAVVCQDLEDAVSALTDPKRVLTSMHPKSERPVAFIFTGLGTHYLNMALELYQGESIFREQVDSCCEILKPLLGLELTDILYPHRNRSSQPSQPTQSTTDTPQSGFDLRKMLGRDQEPTDEATQKLNQTYLTQPAIFVIEYALAQLWMSWGIRPVAMIGYSIGEYVAACLAGVLSREDALTLVAKRAQMIQELPGGAMLAVPLSEEEVRPLLSEKLSLSAINGSKLCVIAGETKAVAQLADQLTEKGLACRRLQTSHAFHSRMMEPIASSLTELVKTISLKPPQIPYLSNVTGTWITEAEATDPSYWTKHMCQPVRFAEGINELWKQQKPILLEVGPGQTLSSLVLQCLETEQVAEKVVLPSVRDAYNQSSDLGFLLNSLGQLWLSGVRIDWSGFSAHESRHRVPLPTYPFERQRYWVEPSKNKQDFNLNQGQLEQKLDITNWFSIPSWKQAAPPVSFEPKLIAQKQSWLVFVDSCGIGSQIIEQLERENQDVVVVRIGEQFDRLGEQEYTINPGKRDDYDSLLKVLDDLNKTPQTIAHLWNITPNKHISSRLECFEKAQEFGFYSLLFLAQALGAQNNTNPLQIGVVSNNMQELLDEEELCPEKATLLGPCKVIPQEYSNITCRSIDIILPQSSTRQWQQLIDQLIAEIATKTSEQVIAYRGNHRWIQDFEPLPMKNKTLRAARLREGGVYVVTGGVGKLGLIVSEYLAKTVQAKLVLIGRSGLPPKAEWTQWLSSHDEQNPLSTKIRKVQALEKLGAEVLVIKADVSNLEQMRTMVKQVSDRFGEINGVVHLAGTPGASFIQARSPETVSSVLEPKVKGTLTLDYALKDVKPDFVLLFSSLTSIVGGLGQADYCAASAFLDAFAHYNFFKQETFTVSINWDNWQENNLQDELISSYGSEAVAEFKKFREKYGITSQEGGEALNYVLSSTVPQVFVSPQTLHYRLENIHEQFANLLQSPEKYLPKSTHQRPNLRTPYIAPSSDIERKITGIYQELLGVELVGINDNFFDLGGNSLIGIQLISRLRQELQVEISINYLFQSPSVAELALVVEEIFIGELEELTEDEAQKLMPVISHQ